MFVLRHRFAECKRLNDPSPDISKYDCRLPGRREGYLIKDFSGQESNILSSRKEEILRTPLGINEDNRSKAWNCCGDDKLKITLNSSARFLMNTAISVTVGFNPQLISELEVKSIDNDVSDLKSSSSSMKSSPFIPMGEYYSPDTFTLHRKHSHSSCVEKWRHPNANFNRTSCSQASPARKRVLSPRNGRSPSKRKAFSPQKNKIYNYFVQSDGVKIENAECSEVGNVSFLHSNIVDNMNCRDSSRFCSNNRNVRNTIEKPVSVNRDIPDIIVISSDEEDSPVYVPMKDVQEKTSWQTHCNTVDLCDEEPMVPVNTCKKLEQNVSNTRNLSVSSSGRPNRKTIDNEICIISSDEENDLWISSQTIVDLTNDDLCSSDDAGGVIIPESKHIPRSSMENDCENDDEDDDCISVISYTPGLLSQRDKFIKDDSNNVSLEEKIETKNVSACANQFSKTRMSLEENIASNESLLDLHAPHDTSNMATSYASMENNFENDEDDGCVGVISCKPGVLSQRERFIQEDSDNVSLEGQIETENFLACADKVSRKETSLEENPESKASFLSLHVPHDTFYMEKFHLNDHCSKVALIHPLEDEGKINDNLLKMQDGNSTDSSLPTPHTFEDNVSMHDTLIEDNDQVTFSKEFSESENYDRIECLEDEEEQITKGKKTNLSSPLEKDKSIFSFNEIVSQCSERKMCEKKIANETTSSDEDNKLSSRVIRPSPMRVCQVQAEILLSKLYQPWIDLDTDEVPWCCETGLAECNSVHGKKAICPEESDFNDEHFLRRMDSGTSAVDLIQSRLDVFVYPTTSVLQNLLFGCMDLWVEGVSEVMKWLRHLLRLHPPCAFGMLDYYRKVLFNPVKDMKALHGIFWLCVEKIEEVVNAVQNQKTEKNAEVETFSDQQESNFIEKFLQDVDPQLPCEKEVHEIKHSNKLKQLCETLDYLIRIMEADLNMGLLKNLNNLKRYTCKTGRPLIAIALWGNQGVVGNPNVKCRHLMKMYLQIFESYHDIEYHRKFRRLVSLMAGVTYASEQNTEPPEYPNVKSNCRDLANSFASIMMASELNMIQVRLILESLTPDWFRLCVCSNLLVKLYGRNMELSLNPMVILFKSLTELNQDYPSAEEISKTLLAEPNTNKTTSKESEELSPHYVKQATKKDKRGETRLHIACRRNNIPEVKRLLNVPNISINEKDNMGWTPLHEASFYGNVECVKSLLNFRTSSGGPAVDLQARNEGGVTPLMDAVLNNHLEVAAVLLQNAGPKLLADKNSDGLSVWDLVHTEEMKHVLLNAQDYGQECNLLAIPRTLYIKLAVLSPLAIKYYIKFSEVSKISHYLIHNTQLTRDRTSSVKFQPLNFKRDYTEFIKLQSFLKEKLNNSNNNNNNNNKLLYTLNSFF